MSVSFSGQLFVEVIEMLHWSITQFREKGVGGGCWEQSIAGAASPWGHICVLCSLSGNILI